MNIKQIVLISIILLMSVYITSGSTYELYTPEVSGTAIPTVVAVASTTFTPVDATGITSSNGYVIVDMKCNNPAYMAPGVSQLEITSAGAPNVEELNYPGILTLGLTSQYKTFIIPLSSFNAFGGEIDVSQIDFMRLYCTAQTGSLTMYFKNAYLVAMEGNGSAANPYTISTIRELAVIPNVNTTGSFVQSGDIDALDSNAWNAGTGIKPLYSSTSKFSGEYNGNGYSISNLLIDNTGTSYTALFKYTDGASIHDVGLYNAEVIGKAPTATLIASAINTDVYNISIIDSSVYSSDGDAAGILGYVSGASNIHDSFYNGTVEADHGFIDYTTACGLAVTSADSTFNDMYFAGTLSANAAEGPSEYASIRDVSNTAYSGLYYDNTLMPTFSRIGSLSSTDPQATGLTTAQMKTRAAFPLFDFVNIWDIQLYTGYEYPIMQYDYNYTKGPEIFYPTPGTIIGTTFPPLETDIEFSWESNYLVSSYTYQIAKDANYYTLIASGTVTSNSKTLALSDGEYWFRVKNNYIAGGSSSYSETNLDIQTTYEDYATALQGVVYTSTDGSQTALSGATVNIYNATFSKSFITGSNGYYLFNGGTGLGAGTYELTVSKDGYETSYTNTVTLYTGATAVKNVVLDPDNAPNYITPHYVQFIVKSITKYYSGVTVTIYEEDSVIPEATLITGSDGSCGIKLDETVLYRITAYKEGIINAEATLYPTDATYKFYVNFDNILIDLVTPSPDDELMAIDTAVSTGAINSTHAYVLVSYEDSMNETQDLYMGISQSIDGDIYNSTLIDYVELGSNNSEAYNFTISNYEGESFLITIRSTHNTFGDFTRVYSIIFASDSTEFDMDNELLGWLAICILAFVMWTASPANVPQTAIAVCGLASFLMLFGWGAYISTGGLVISWVIALVANFAVGKES
jgi:hypothetical protein